MPTNGDSNGNWREGRTTHKAGYVMRRTETVHHINGVKDDNRPENLELWVKPQPAGIRARDAVAWAHAILERYGDGFRNSSNNAHSLD